ncbi:MAG: TlpA disulfide reductase family protein [Chloroflexota bacterium]
MPSRRRIKRKQKNTRYLAMTLVGVGLLILSGVALVLLPGAERSSADPVNSGQAASAPGEASSVPVAVDFAAPQLDLLDLQDKPVSLSDFAGQVVLVNNWATWCPPCKAEMPVLHEYYQQHSRQGFIIVAIAAGEAPQQVAAFVEQYGLTFPVWPDPTQSAMDAFRNFNLPSSYVIDRSGQVRLAWTGAISRAMLEKHVTPLLED